MDTEIGQYRVKYPYHLHPSFYNKKTSASVYSHGKSQKSKLSHLPSTEPLRLGSPRPRDPRGSPHENALQGPPHLVKYKALTPFYAYQSHYVCVGGGLRIIPTRRRCSALVAFTRGCAPQPSFLIRIWIKLPFPFPPPGLVRARRKFRYAAPSVPPRFSRRKRIQWTIWLSLLEKKIDFIQECSTTGYW